MKHENVNKLITDIKIEILYLRLNAKLVFVALGSLFTVFI